MVTVEDHSVNSKLGKRKRGTTEHVNGNAKFEEYLHVMQPASKSKIWSNEDRARQPEWPRSTFGSPGLNTTVDHQNGNYEIIPPKFEDRKLLEYSEAKPTTSTTVLSQSDIIPEAPSLLDQELPLITDGDWMRSRTGNLVEVDRNDDATPLNASPGTDLLAQELITDQVSKSMVSDSSIQAEAASGSQISTPAASAGYAAGRIYVRNLAYASTEDDLREYFTSQGLDSVQEVRSVASLTFFFGNIIFLAHYMMNILIGTTYV